MLVCASVTSSTVSDPDCSYSIVSDPDCSYNQFSELVSKTNISFQLSKFTLARQHGEQALNCGRTVSPAHSPRFIKLLNRLNHTYQKLGRLSEVQERVKEAYTLSKNHMGDGHEVTMQSRDLYYGALIQDKDYIAAISLANENIAASKDLHHEEFRRHHYLIQLYSLYGLTGQYEKEAETLIILIDMVRKLFGSDDEETKKYTLDLAKSYCRQGAESAFKDWINKHNLEYSCN